MKTLAKSLIVIFLILVSIVGLRLSKKSGTIEPNEERFIGKISYVNRSCDHDGTCYIVVDEKRIVFDPGGDSGDPTGRILGKEFITKQDVGQKVEIYALRYKDHLVVFGNKYYIKFLSWQF